MTTVKRKTTKTGAKKVRRKIKMDRTVLIFLICLALIMIPILIFGWVLLSASLDTGKPILGDRYKGDLDPAIKKADISSVESAVKGVSGVESVDVELAAGTLRVYADIEDSANGDAVKSRCADIYSSVSSVLDPNIYFTQSDGKKMYDLEIHVYNLAKNRESEEFAYAIETKNSSMEEPIIQLVSEPVNAELAQQLRDAVEQRNNPTPTPEETTEITLGSEDVEEVQQTQEESGEE